MVVAWLKWLFGSNDDSKKELEEENRIFNEIIKSEEIETPTEEDIGVVTRSLNGIIEINKNWIAYEQLLSIKVGSLVTFTKPANPESNIVSNVELLNNISQKTNLKDKVINQGVISFIDNEKILLNPGSLIFWKNDVEVTYRPEIGDYVKLENCNGFLRLYPKECKIITDEVMDWNGKTGFLKNHTKITTEVCDSFYFPKVGDNVITCIIPCEGDTYEWRSLNVAKVDSARCGNRKIEVKNVPVFIVPFGKEKIIEVTVKNTFFKSIEIVKVKIIPETSYVTLLENSIKMIEPAIGVTYRILCKGTVLGWTSFTLEFKFKKFIYHKSVKFLTTEDNSEEILLQDYDSNRPLNFVDRVHKPNFLRIKPKTYEIPLYLLEICGSSDKNRLDCMSLLQRQLPELSKGLTMNTYAIFFHTLLFLEEIAQVQAMEELETVAPLVRRGEFYVFIFEDGTNYSSLCPGDTVLISNPWLDDDDSEPTQTELKVWTRKHNEIYLKFKDIFNIVGNRGTLFRMKFRNNRTCTVRTHHAIDYFIKRADIKWLFPDLIQRNPFNNCSSNQPLLVPSKIKYFFDELDHEQREAVNDIVFTKDNLDYPYLLFGPPGTGKTVTLVETTLQTLRIFPNCRILIAAPSNSAVDTFCSHLVTKGNISKAELIRLISFNYSQLGQLPVNLVEYAAVLSHSPEVQNDIRICDVENLGQFKIIVGTLNTLGILNCMGLRSGHFTHVFIDEAGQTTEPDTLIPLATMKPGFTRIVLAGDPNQLGPVIISQIAKAYHLGESLMMRLMNYPMYSRCFEKERNSVKPKVATMLRKNYRALPILVSLLSDLFYRNQLEAMMSSNSREARILNTLKDTSFGSSGSSLIVIKVNGKEEYLHGEKNSFWNMMEAARISVITLELLKIGITTEQIGIITPYSLQVKKMKECFSSLRVEPPKIGTVEEFQGSERDIIIISLVRTTLDECRLSFICDPKRANVSLSRAKVMNIILGNEVTLRMSHLWGQVLNKAVLINPTA